MNDKSALVILFVGGLCLGDSRSIQSQPPQQLARRVSFAEVLRREDANQDGKVTKDEFKAAPRLFERFDRNGDDVLTKEDFADVPNRQRDGRSAPDDVNVLRDVVFGTGGGRDLTMHLVLPKEKSDTPLPAYVWIHGGGWQNGTKEGGVGQVVPLVRSGFVGATIEYRLTGEAAFPAQIEDCKCAIRFLRQCDEIQYRHRSHCCWRQFGWRTSGRTGRNLG